MSKISLIAKLPCQDGKNDEMEAALADLIEAANEEAGLEIYSAHKADDDNTYWFFELYSDAGAVEAHGKGDAMKAAMGAVGGFLAGKPEIVKATPVVAKGIDV